MSPPDPGTPFTVLETASTLRREADTRIAGRLRSLPSGDEVSCREGCCACCSQLVVVSPMEAHAIAGFLAEDPARQMAAADGIARWERSAAAHPDLAASLDAFDACGGYLPADEGGGLEMLYWRARIPCPFLRDSRCSIYPVRPFACREHHVLSDPSLCETNPDAARPAPTRMEFRAVAGWVGEILYALPDRLLALPRSLQYAAAHPEETERSAPAERVRAESERAQRRARLALARLVAVDARERRQV